MSWRHIDTDVAFFANQRFCSNVGVSAETKLAILHHSPNSFPGIGVLAGLVERLVVVTGCRVVE